MHPTLFYSPGMLIANRYEVASRPMMGGMGIVYICFDHEEQHPVALKTFKPEYLPDRAARDRFLREGTMWVDLGAHLHTVQCYNVVRTDNWLEVYLVLELIAKEPGCEDASLRSWLMPGKPLPIDQALLFALQIARGMKHATEVIPGFVHRDLKPENVLVGADKLANAKVNRVRVTDFGLATVLQEASQPVGESAISGQQPTASNEQPIGQPEPRVTRTQLTHGIVGTPLYMAPEQWQGEPVSVATDVYALGCILFEMLTGQRAVRGGRLETLRQAHCQGQVRPLPRDLPSTVCELLRRSLALDPGARFGEWGEVEAALGVAYAQACGQAAPEPETSQTISCAERVAAGWSYGNIGSSYLDIGKAAVARDYFEQAVEVGRAEGERALEGATLGNLGNAYVALGDARRAIGYYEQCLALHREIGDRRGEGSALMGLGLAYAALGDARRAIGYYEQCLALHREIGDRRGEGIALGNLGAAYRDLGDAQRAMGYHEQALTIGREIGDRRGEGDALGNLGLAYAALGDVRRAIGCFEQRLEIAREIGDRRGEGNALGNLGQAYADLGDVRRAIGHFEQSLTIHREIGDAKSVAADLFNMARMYAQQGEVAHALSLAQQASQIWEQIGSPYAQRAQQLAAQLQGEGIASGDASTGDLAHLAFDEFQHASSLAEMRRAVAQFPFMVEPGFISAIERVMSERVLPQHKPAFEQGLAWLRHIAKGK